MTPGSDYYRINRCINDANIKHTAELALIVGVSAGQRGAGGGSSEGNGSGVDRHHFAIQV